jgi:hypothetical protein
MKPQLASPACGDLDNEPVDRLDELLSLLFDDGLDEPQASELNQMLLADPAARTRSLEAAQLHADLYAYFRDGKQAKPGSAIAPPLPLLIPGSGFTLFK